MTVLIDKSIVKVNQNELHWYEIFFQQLILYLKTTGYSLTAYSYLKSKFKMVFIWEVIT
jgi:diketogulonate reductase-like aldo/keto reductase